MPLYTKENRNILFIHIPKTGGSSIDASLKSLGFRCFFEIRGLPPQDFLKASPQHLVFSELQRLVDTRAIDTIFTVIRNPYSRILSEFLWQHRQSSDMANLPNLYSWLDSRFTEYLNEPTVDDNHIRPMTEFILPSEKCLVYKFEDGLPQAMYCIMADKSFLLNDIFPFPHLKSSRNLPISPKKSICFDISEKAEKLISDFYASDFESFGYMQSDPALSLTRFARFVSSSKCRPAPDASESKKLYSLLQRTSFRSKQYIFDSLAHLTSRINDQHQTSNHFSTDNNDKWIAAKGNKHSKKEMSKQISSREQAIRQLTGEVHCLTEEKSRLLASNKDLNKKIMRLQKMLDVNIKVQSEHLESDSSAIQLLRESIEMLGVVCGEELHS